MRAPDGRNWIAAVLLVAPLSAAARVTGTVEVQSQTVRSLGAIQGFDLPSTTATLLQETVALHYAGLPFGPSAALITMGGGFTNIDGALGDGANVHGRAYSWDLSAAFLPRRAYPLRLFTRGSVVDGPPGVVASTGGALSLAYGGSLNLEPGQTLPGLRLEVEEARSSHLSDRPLGDLRRVVTATGFKAYGAELVNLTLRLDDEFRDEAGNFRSRLANLTWSSPTHETLLLASEVRHSGTDIAGLTSERQASATHLQRWSSRFSTDAALRLAEATANEAYGLRGNAQTGFSYQPFVAHQVIFSASGDAGFTKTESPDARASGSNYGANGRVGYTRPIGIWQTSAFLGVNADTCRCEFGNSGTQTGVGGGLSTGTTTAGRVLLQGDYSVQKVFAPLARGGRRLEQHARATSRLPVTEAVEAGLSLGYDDGYREIIDLSSGTAYTLRELAGSGTASLIYRLERGSVNAELRHARGTVIVPPSRFVSGVPASARMLTSGSLSGAYAVVRGLDVTLQLAGSWTELSNAAPMTSTAGTAGAVYRFGRMTFSAQYQVLRTEFGGQSSTQTTLRAAFSRPFEL